MTTAVWVTVAGLCVATAVIKAFGPVVFGARDLPRVLARAIPLLAPALLAASGSIPRSTAAKFSFH